MRGSVLVGFILAALLGECAISQFFDHVNMIGVFEMMATVSFISMWAFLFYTFHVMKAGMQKLMFTFLFGMFFSLAVCSISFTQLQMMGV
jgi:hypothetical protein